MDFDGESIWELYLDRHRGPPGNFLELYNFCKIDLLLSDVKVSQAKKLYKKFTKLSRKDGASTRASGRRGRGTRYRSKSSPPKPVVLSPTTGIPQLAHKSSRSTDDVASDSSDDSSAERARKKERRKRKRKLKKEKKKAAKKQRREQREREREVERERERERVRERELELARERQRQHERECQRELQRQRERDGLVLVNDLALPKSFAHSPVGGGSHSDSFETGSDVKSDVGTASTMTAMECASRLLEMELLDEDSRMRSAAIGDMPIGIGSKQRRRGQQQLALDSPLLSKMSTTTATTKASATMRVDSYSARQKADYRSGGVPVEKRSLSPKKTLHPAAAARSRHRLMTGSRPMKRSSSGAMALGLAALKSPSFAPMKTGTHADVTDILAMASAAAQRQSTSSPLARPSVRSSASMSTATGSGKKLRVPLKSRTVSGGGDELMSSRSLGYSSPSFRAGTGKALGGAMAKGSGMVSEPMTALKSAAVDSTATTLSASVLEVLDATGVQQIYELDGCCRKLRTEMEQLTQSVKAMQTDTDAVRSRLLAASSLRSPKMGPEMRKKSSLSAAARERALDSLTQEYERVCSRLVQIDADIKRRELATDSAVSLDLEIIATVQSKVGKLKGYAQVLKESQNECYEVSDSIQLLLSEIQELRRQSAAAAVASFVISSSDELILDDTGDEHSEGGTRKGKAKRRKGGETPGVTKRASIGSVPDEFVCPITMVLMSDPVVTADGHVYERKAIEDWFEDNDISPLTGTPLQNKNLIPLHVLRSQIAKFRKLYPHLSEYYNE